MPGYNHHPWCVCGWCQRNGWGAFSTSEAQRCYDTHSARFLLQRASADRGHMACFVQPNATCPVCRASVFYYQNRFGSRVFFDELGPPWPKHHCTSKPFAAQALRAGDFPALSRRARGNRIEVAQALRTLKLDPVSSFRTAYGKPPHPVYVVCSAVSRGSVNVAKAEPLVLSAGEPVFVGFMSDRVRLFAGDLIAFDGETISALNETFEGLDIKAKLIGREKFSALQDSIPDSYQEGLCSPPGPLDRCTDDTPLTEPAGRPGIRPNWPTNLSCSFPVPAGTRKRTGTAVRSTPIPMTRDESYHYGHGNIDRAQFLARLRPMVRDLSRNGLRKPKQVAHMLNKKGVRTAAGVRWSPRLAWFLLDLLFNAAGPGGQMADTRATAQRSGPPRPGRPQDGAAGHATSVIAFDTRSDLALKLSERFRVKLTH